MIALKSSDAALQSITVSAGTLSPAFNPDTLSYILTVPESITEVTVTATARHSGATVEGGGYRQLHDEWASFDIHVTAEDSITVKTYAVQVYRSTANGGDNPVDFQLYSAESAVSAVSAVSADRIPLQNIIITAGVLVPAFHPDTLDYAILVPYHTTEITATGTAADGRVISYTKALPYPGSITHFPFCVIGCRTYDIAVTRPSDATLKNLTVTLPDQTDVVLSPSFHPDTLNYTATVPNSVTGIEVAAEPSNTAASVTGDIIHSLNVGDNIIEVVITAENPSYSKTYTLAVRRVSSDATLKSLTLKSKSGAIPLKFQPSIFKYRVEVGSEVSEIVIDCEANPGTTVLNAGVHTLDYGENVFTVTVKAEDFETQYTITVYRLRNDATLKYLVIAPVELTPPFDPDITQYTAKFPFSNTANVPYSVSSISMDFDVNDSLAELWTNPELERPGTKQLNVGENVFGIGVSAEDKRYYRAYWIRITREAPPVTTGLDEAGAPAAVQVYTANGRLYVNSPATERINIYSVTGTLLYSFDKPAGAFTLHPLPFTLHRY